METKPFSIQVDPGDTYVFAATVTLSSKYTVDSSGNNVYDNRNIYDIEKDIINLISSSTNLIVHPTSVYIYLSGSNVTPSPFTLTSTPTNYTLIITAKIKSVVYLSDALHSFVLLVPKLQTASTSVYSATINFLSSGVILPSSPNLSAYGFGNYGYSPYV